MVDAVSALGATATTKSTESLGKLAEDFDDFLKILIVQLQNQDPTDPLDSNEFTQQIVSFTGVEQSVATNKNLESLISMTQSTQNSALVSFVGKDVEVEGSLVTLKEGATEPVTFSYTLNEPVKNAFVTVKNLNNETIFNGTGPITGGRNNVQWNGTNNDGDVVEPGLYQIFVTTENSDGNLNNETTLVQGKVVGVVLEDEAPKLIVNGEEVPLDEVKFVGNLS